MALVEVDYSYKVKEWGFVKWEVEDPIDLDNIEGQIRQFVLDQFDPEDEVTDITIENTKELIS